MGVSCRFHVMLPDAQDAPTLQPEQPVHLPVTGFVGLQLCQPEGPIALGMCGVLWAAMPKATVHEHGQLQLRESKVRLPFYGVVTPPASDAVNAEQCGESYFGGLVAFAPDAGHDCGTLLLGENISHS